MFKPKWKVATKFVEPDGTVAGENINGVYRTKMVAKWHFDIAKNVAHGPEMEIAALALQLKGGPIITFEPYMERVA